MEVRTRFAPSPTGYLHLGGARTALYAWLYARHHQGKFFLRIEDTDRERSTDDAIQAIFAGMEWLGLDHDEQPVYQTQRFDRYQQVINQLLNEGKAYKCYCSKERLHELREQQMTAKQKPKYDGRCRHPSSETAHDFQNHSHGDSQRDYVIRFKNPEQGNVTIHDQVYGDITIQNKELDDLIIARADGTPTYNLCVVVDDWDMKITHVIRGDDHLNNTPRQINILKALQAPIPIYAHVPMILGQDGKKLSKRQGAVSVIEYRNLGFLPAAMVNYLLRLGWSYGDQELFSRQEMCELFTLDNLSRSASAFNLDKLTWVNQHYIKEGSEVDLLPEFKHQLAKKNLQGSDEELISLINIQRDRAKTLKEMAEKSACFLGDIQYDQTSVDKHLTSEVRALLVWFQQAFTRCENWHEDNLNALVKAAMNHFQLKMGKVAQPLRVATTGSTQSPAIGLTLEKLGKTQVLERLQKSLDLM